MIRKAVIGVLAGLLLAGASAFAAPCPAGSKRIACVIPLEYGIGKNGQPFSASSQGVFASQEHEGHFDNSLSQLLGPVTAEIGRQSNLLPLASPSSGILLTYDSSLKTFVPSTDSSLGPVLGERAETVGRHRVFVGFSYQFFNFNKIDGVNLHDFPVMLPHADDNVDNTAPGQPTPTVCKSAVSATTNLNGCAFVRDLISTANSIDLKINQYTTYVTFGLTSHIDVSFVLPIENVRMSLRSQDTIILGTNGLYAVKAGTPDSQTLPPRFNHLWGNCPDPKPAAGVSGLDPRCLNHVFPDPGLAQGGSSGSNSATGIGDVVARVKWNAWHGERAGVSAGLDLRLPTGDELNYLGSGTYGAKPFAIFSYRARISPHALVGYEWNGKSITAGDFVTGTKAKVPNDLAYSVGADASVTKWLTASFDVIGQHIFSTSTNIGGDIFGTQALSVVPQQFLAPCGTCTANPDPPTVTHNNLQLSANTRSYNVTNASMGVKFRPLGKISKLVVTANLLVRLDEGGLSYKPVPLVGVGYTF